MKKTYAAPQVVEYGRIDELTLGSGGSLPDYDEDLNLINNNCPTFVIPGVSTRTACINATS